MATPGGAGHGAPSGAPGGMPSGAPGGSPGMASSGGGSPYGGGYDTGSGGGSNPLTSGAGGYPGTSGGYPGTSGGYPGAGGAAGYPGAGGGGAPGMGNLSGINPMSFLNSMKDFKPQEIKKFPKEYGAQAQLAFQQGYEELGTKLLMGHLAFERSEAAATYEQVRMSSDLKRPAWHLRWGLAIHVDTPTDFSGGLDPITAETKGTGGSGGGAMGTPPSGLGTGTPGLPPGVGGAPGGYPGAGAAGNTGTELQGGTTLGDISAALGLFADVTGEMFDSRFGRGDFGVVFSKYARRAPAAAAAGGAGAGQAPGIGAGMGAPGMGAPGMGGGGGPPRPASAAGPGGSSPPIPAGYPGGGIGAGPGLAAGPGGSSPPIPAGYPGGGIGAGPGGAAPPGMPMGPGGLGNGFLGNSPASPPADLATALPIDHPQWRPGIVYLGQMTESEAIGQAKRHGIDYLIHFTVNVEKRKEEVDNQTRGKVINVASTNLGSGRGSARDVVTIGSSKKLGNREVKSKLKDGNPKRFVVDALQPMFDAIDQKVVLTEFPMISSAQAKARVASLLTGNSEGDLNSMAEIQLYRHRSLLTDDEVLLAAEILFGDNGLRLLAGNPQVMREAATAIQKRLTSYGEIGMVDPAMAALAGSAAGGGMPGMGGAMPGAGGMTPGAPSLDSGGGAGQGGGGGTGSAPPIL